jgi:hypothetical protein
MASITLYGNAYFLSNKILINIEFAPEYFISASLSRAAAECNMGMEHLVSTLPTMMASRSVQLLDSHRGNKMPLKNADGLNRALRSAIYK